MANPGWLALWGGFSSSSSPLIFFFLPVLLSAGRCSHSGNAPCARLTTSVDIHLILIGVLEDFNVELSAILSGLTQDVLPSPTALTCWDNTLRTL